MSQVEWLISNGCECRAIFSKMAVAFCYTNHSCSRLLHKRRAAFRLRFLLLRPHPARQADLLGTRHTHRARLADGTLYQTDLDQAVALQARDGVIEEELMAALERWETLSSHS